MSLNIPETSQKRVVIVGAGFGGMMLAQKLIKSDFQVVLIDKNNYHQFQPLLYQVAMSGLEPSSISFPLRKVFQKKKNVIIRVTSVVKVDTENNQIFTPIGRLHFDYLVIAFGVETNFFGNKHLEERTIPMKTVSEALFLRNAILDDYEKAVTTTDFEKRQRLVDIVIVGGGPTGVEVAGALAEMKKYILPKDYPEFDIEEIDIYLIQGGAVLLEGMSEKASKAAERFLKKIGVKIIFNRFVTDFDGAHVKMNDGSIIRANKVIWAAGVAGKKLEGLSDSVFEKGNRIKVNRFNQVDGFDNIFAIGDICYMEEKAFPKGHPQMAQIAIQQAKLLAKNFKKIERGETLKPFSYRDLGSMATVGRNRAVVDFPGYKFQGFFAWVVWLTVHLLSLIGVKNKLLIFINWMWNYLTYDQSLRVMIKPKIRTEESVEQTKEEQ
jgi:NADH:quinone reductase (non-electrogenic)